MTTKLEVWNIALLALGERKLDSDTEDREPQRIMSEIWTRGQGVVRYFLEQGHWNHAMRTQEIDKSATVTPSFGFANAFEKPTDFIRLNMISADENFSFPLMEYEMEANHFYAWADPIYMRFVSDDVDYGNDLSLWPETFTLWAGYYMATQATSRLKNDIDMAVLEKRTNKYLIDARSKDAMNEPTRFPPMSSWNRARLSGAHGDRGHRNKLIG